MADKWLSGFDPYFLDAAATCARTGNSTDNKPALKKYFETKLRYSHFNWFTKLASRLGSTIKPPKVAAGQVNTLGLPGIQFIYMDVGCWAGASSKDAHGWTKHREFGVVFSHLVFLCSFGYELGYYDPAPVLWADFKTATVDKRIDPAIQIHPDYPRVEAFLNHLAGKSDDHEPHPIGKLHILAAAMVNSWLISTPSSSDQDAILVFIGDLHAPTTTGLDDAQIVENGKQMLRGRLDMVPPGLGPIPPWVIDPMQGLAGYPGWLTAQIFSTMSYDASTSLDSVRKWVADYHADTGARADIFQDAGQDLRTFVDHLRNYHESESPLRVIQLGDFFDLWLGFQRAFKDSIDDPLPCASDFARLWVERTLLATRQGSHLAHLLTLSQTAKPNRKTGAPLHTHFIYGNHDNYRRHGGGADIALPSDSKHSGLKIHVFNAPPALDYPGLWAEHGHQKDPSNSDESPAFGHGLTQLAFLQPGVRGIEGFTTWANADLWEGDRNQLPRVVCIRHAMDQCLINVLNSSAPCRGMYVMGHSHEPMLKKVELWPSPPRN
jgi:hypothetical protein